LKLLELFVSSDFIISNPQFLHVKLLMGGVMFSTLCPTRTSDCQIIVSDFLDSDHLPIVFSVLDPVRTSEALDPAEKFTDWELFRSLVSDLISPSSHIYSSEKGDKLAADFAAFMASAYKLSTRKATILDPKYESPYLDLLLKHKMKPRKVYQETS
jgi:hypothetical protein